MPLCYKDKTFCPFWMLCKQGHGCSRACTEQLAKDAEEFGLPIAVYSEFPECFIAFFEQTATKDPK